jgi:hypothetical protein
VHSRPAPQAPQEPQGSLLASLSQLLCIILICLTAPKTSPETAPSFGAAWFWGHKQIISGGVRHRKEFCGKKKSSRTVVPYYRLRSLTENTVTKFLVSYCRSLFSSYYILELLNFHMFAHHSRVVFSSHRYNVSFVRSLILTSNILRTLFENRRYL